jgi:hypothetical protein
VINVPQQQQLPAGADTRIAQLSLTVGGSYILTAATELAGNASPNLNLASCTLLQNANPVANGSADLPDSVAAFAPRVADRCSRSGTAPDRRRRKVTAAHCGQSPIAILVLRLVNGRGFSYRISPGCRDRRLPHAPQSRHVDAVALPARRGVPTPPIRGAPSMPRGPATPRTRQRVSDSPPTRRESVQDRLKHVAATLVKVSASKRAALSLS